MLSHGKLPTVWRVSYCQHLIYILCFMEILSIDWTFLLLFAWEWMVLKIASIKKGETSNLIAYRSQPLFRLDCPVWRIWCYSIKQISILTFFFILFVQTNEDTLSLLGRVQSLNGLLVTDSLGNKFLVLFFLFWFFGVSWCFLVRWVRKWR